MLYEKEIQEARELLNAFNQKLQEVQENQYLLNENLAAIAEQNNKLVKAIILIDGKNENILNENLAAIAEQNNKLVKAIILIDGKIDDLQSLILQLDKDLFEEEGKNEKMPAL